MQNKLVSQALILVMLLVFSGSIAQKTNIYKNPDALYKNAIQLYEHGKYSVAQRMFDEFIKQSGKTESFQVEEAEYYSSRCAAHLFNRDADYSMSKYIYNHKNAEHYQDASLSMALFQFQKKKYRRAVKWFDKVDENQLEKEIIPEYYFKYGYCLYQKENIDKASLMFYEIIDSIGNEYNSSAIYYYAHIAYRQKKYQTSLDNFIKLQEDDIFSTIVPYYITQVYFLQGKYDKIIETAPLFIDSVSEKRYPEIARILGEAYFQTKEYKEAIPYLEIYKEYAIDLTYEDLYQLGYSYYKTKDYNNAIDLFQKVTNANDTLSQKSDVALADCYIKIGQKGKAMTAFQSASEISIDKETQEEALFNYAKLSYELSASPFDDAIDAFTNYVNLYPDSKYTDEAYDFLGKAYRTTKNYQAAIESYEQIKNITKEVEIAYQRITFFRGIELFKNGYYSSSIINFNKSLNNTNFNKKIRARTFYWRGEAYYRMHRYNDAISSFTEFSTTPGAYLLDEYANLHYNLGYCYFKKKNYKEAVSWYRKYTDIAKDKNTEVVNDAYLRIGDCFFMINKASFAIDYYDKAIVSSKRDVDYALFQKGFSLGLQGKGDEKIIVLSKILNDFDKSIYADDATFEIASVYLNQEQYDMAINFFSNLINDYPKSPYIPKSYDKLGLIYVNQKNYDEAIESYKYVIENYQGSKEAQNAKFGLETIYLKILGETDKYFAYLNSINQGVDISEAEQDSISYASAERFYLHEDCNKSKELFAKYIAKYKNGKYLLSANFYKAECNYKAGEKDEALVSYSYIASLAKSKFTEKSLEKACEITYSQEKYSEAIEYYKKLEKYADKESNVYSARLGIMRCYFKEEDYSKSLKAAINVLKDNKISDNIFREAHYVIATSFYKQNDLEGAFDEYQILADEVDTKEGAEAKYRIIEIYFLQSNTDDAEIEIREFKKSTTAYKNWVAKSYIIWSKIFVSRDDYYMAKKSLEVVLNGYKNEDDGVLEEIREQYKVVEEKEKAFEELNKKVEVEVIEEVDDVDKLIDNDEEANPDEEELENENIEPDSKTELENE